MICIQVLWWYYVWFNRHLKWCNTTIFNNRQTKVAISKTSNGESIISNYFNSHFFLLFHLFYNFASSTTSHEKVYTLGLVLYFALGIPCWKSSTQVIMTLIYYSACLVICKLITNYFRLVRIWNLVMTMLVESNITWCFWSLTMFDGWISRI